MVIIILFLKVILIMDFKRFILKIYVHICYHSKYWNEILKKMSLIKIILWHIPLASKKRLLSLLSLCVTCPLFLNEIMKNQILNKIVCSVTINVSATVLFSIYNKLSLTLPTSGSCLVGIVRWWTKAPEYFFLVYNKHKEDKKFF
jgi:hypothetical protein